MIRGWSWHGIAGSASWMTVTSVVDVRHIYKYKYYLHIDFD